MMKRIAWRRASRMTCCVVLSLLSLFNMGRAGNSDTLTLTSEQGDKVEVEYDVNFDTNKVVIKFNKANVTLGERNRKYSGYQSQGLLKVIFIDGKNYFGKVVKIEPTPAVKQAGFDSFTTPAKWTYKGKGENDRVFTINEEGAEEITLEIADDARDGTLEIPIYLAKYRHTSEKKAMGKTIRPEKLTYEPFSKCGPLTIKLHKPVPETPRTKTATVIDTVPVIDPSPVPNDGQSPDVPEPKPEPKPEPVQPEIDPAAERDAQSLYNTLTESVKRCKCVKDYENLSDSIDTLSGYTDKKISEHLQTNINTLCEKFNNEWEAAKAKWNNWLMFIIAAVLGFLGLGSNQLVQHVRNKKNERRMMNMQGDVMRRAQEEAKRRMRSKVRNKTHQMMGEAKQKSRKTLRDTAAKVGESVRGDKTATNAPRRTIGGTPDNRSGRGTKGNSNGKSQYNI